MKCKIFGIQEYNFDDPKTGRNVSGCNLYIGYQDKNVRGIKATKVACPNSVNPRDLEPDKVYNIECDFNGRILDIQPMK